MTETEIRINSNGSTPKRRLSFVGNGNIESPIELAKNLGNMLTESPLLEVKKPHDGNKENDSPSNESPFIKRKCFNKEQLPYLSVARNESPCSVSTCDLVELYTQTDIPVLLNESFETLKLVNKEENELRKLQARNKGRRASYQPIMQKHKSAPLTSLNLNRLMSNCEIRCSQPASSRRQSVANIGTNKATTPTLSSFDNGFTMTLTASDDESNEESRNELEDLIYGEVDSTSCVEIDNADHHLVIKHSLEIDATCTNLIGDRSKQHILPIIPSAKHQDLYCISPETLVDVLQGNFDDQIDEFIIIDSRYPYEYEGGHIQNALNIFTKDKLFEEMFVKRLCFNFSKSIEQQKPALATSASTNRIADFLKEFRKTSQSASSQKRVIVIFHCEFSSERGPSLLRFLRNQDRHLNKDIYPYLHYPELYLLEGGYKSFYENFKGFCDPQTYKPMLHAEHLNDLKHFRAKAKSWEVSNNLHNLQKKRPSVVRIKSDQN